MPRVEPQFPWLEDWATEEEKLKGSKLSNRPPPEDRTPKQRNGGNILQARLEGAKAPYSPSSSLRQSDDELVEQVQSQTMQTNTHHCMHVGAIECLCIVYIFIRKGTLPTGRESDVNLVARCTRSQDMLYVSIPMYEVKQHKA